MDDQEDIISTLSGSYHFIGIGGIGMSALARILLARKQEVSGSDLKSSYVTEMLKDEGAKIFVGHAAENLAEKSTVIYTTGVSEENPEFSIAKERGYPLLHRSDLLHLLAQEYKLLAVSGTHGKTTTSALLSHVLRFCGFDPAYAIGGILPQYGSNGGTGQGGYFVVEACESDGTFLKYHSFGAILTNIDDDHLDYYGSQKSLKEAFQEFASKVGSKEHFFWCADDPQLKEMKISGHSYGFDKDCDLVISNFLQEGWNIRFDLEFLGKTYANIFLPLIGKHNAQNAAAVFGLCLSLGAEEAKVREAFLGFKGIKRRVEPKGEIQNILFLDDYAHHPAEIKTTLQGIKEAIGARRLIAVYQPHRYTRSRDCMGSYQGAFDAADEVIITEIYGAGEQPIVGITDELIFEDIAKNCASHLRFCDKIQLVEQLANYLRPHDVVVTLGAGDITELSSLLFKRFQQEPLRKLRIGLIFGGQSVEHEISLISTRNIASALNMDIYDVEYFYISKTGDWTAGSEALVQLNRPAEINEKQEARAHVHRRGEEKTSFRISGKVIEDLQRCELLFPVLHGPFGEDGTIQGLFEMINLPYVGGGHCSSAISMDKAITKEMMRINNIPTVEFLTFFRHQWKKNKAAVMEEVKQKYPLPVYVKPVHLGSALGVGKASSLVELESALEKAFQMDEKLIVEREIVGREIEFAVMGNSKTIVFPPGEVFTGSQMYDYDSKYGPNGMKTTASAELSPKLIQEGMFLAKKAYEAVGCKGLARVDFFLDRENKFWLNEINPIPGFTKGSLFPLMCQANGISYPELLDRLIIYALEPK